MTKKQPSRKKIALISIAFLAIYFVAGYTNAVQELTDKEMVKYIKEQLKKTNPELLEKMTFDIHNKAAEQISTNTDKKLKRVKIISRPEIKSKKDLTDYKNQRLTLINKLSKEDENTEVVAIINFKKLLTREEYLEFVKEYSKDIELSSIRIRSTHHESGKISISNKEPLPSKERTEYEENHKKDMGLKDYKFLTHIQTLKGKIKAKDLKKIQNDPRVFLVDVGPIDIKEMYEPKNNEVQMQWRYIFPEIEKYNN